MRITLVHPYPWPEVRRGAERYVDDLARYLNGAGHDVTLVTGTTDAPGTLRRADGVVEVRRPQLHVRGAHRMGVGEVETFGLRALRPLRQSRPDVVHAMTPTAALAARAAGCPTLYTVLGHPAADQLPADAVPRLLFAAAVRRSTDVAVLSRASAGALQASLGRAASVLPPGLRSERFPADLTPRTGPPRILFSASLSDPRKHAALAVHAFGVLLQRRPDARLVLSGQGDPAPLLDGAPDARTRAAIDTPGPGRPDDVPARYRAASVTVLPAEHEAFGLALVESLASGTPVVCTPAGGMPEIVTPEVGRVAAGTDAEELADALDAALSLAAVPGTAARCAARAAHWDWDTRIGPEHLALYERLAGARGRRRATSSAAVA